MNGCKVLFVSMHYQAVALSAHIYIKRLPEMVMGYLFLCKSFFFPFKVPLTSSLLPPRFGSLLLCVVQKV